MGLYSDFVRFFAGILKLLKSSKKILHVFSWYIHLICNYVDQGKLVRSGLLIVIPTGIILLIYSYSGFFNLINNGYVCSLWQFIWTFLCFVFFVLNIMGSFGGMCFIIFGTGVLIYHLLGKLRPSGHFFWQDVKAYASGQKVNFYNK